MRLLLRKLFPGRRRSAAITALSWCDRLFADQMFWEDVRAEAEQYLLRASVSSLAIFDRSDGHAGDAILRVIARLAEAKIIYGNAHVYRGRLGLPGASYRVIATRAIEQLIEQDGISHEDGVAWLDDIDEAVRGAG